MALKAVAEQLLLSSPLYSKKHGLDLLIPNDEMEVPVALPSPFLLWVSQHNDRAQEVAGVLESELSPFLQLFYRRPPLPFSGGPSLARRSSSPILRFNFGRQTSRVDGVARHTPYSYLLLMTYYS